MSALLDTFVRECQTNVSEEDSSISDALDTLLACEPVEDALCQVAKQYLFTAANKKSFDEYAERAEQTSSRKICGVVCGGENCDMYRCRTCKVNDAMCLCKACFEAGPHRENKHDYFQLECDGDFGTCDCGDDEVMKLEGSCPRHGSIEPHRNNGEIDEFFCSARRVLPRLVVRMVEHTRLELDVRQLHAVSDLLVTVAHWGSEFVDAIIHALSDAGFYRRTLKADAAQWSSSGVSSAVGKQIQQLLTDDVLQRVPQDCRPFLTFRHECMLDELVFWLVRLHLPSQIGAVLLACCCDVRFRASFARSFARHYALFSVVHLQNQDTQSASEECKSLDLYTCNFFENPSLSLMLAEQDALLERQIAAIRILLHAGGAVEFCSLSSNSTLRKETTVNATHQLASGTGLWTLVTDVCTTLKHVKVTMYLLQQPALFSKYLELLSLWQGTFVLHRRFARDGINDKAAQELIDIDERLCSDLLFRNMFALAENLSLWTASYRREVISALLHEVIKAINIWFERTCLFDDDSAADACATDPDKFTYFLPLHRFLAAFLALHMRYAQLDCDTNDPSEASGNILLSPAQCSRCVQHLLDLQSGEFQAINGVWRSNGSNNDCNYLLMNYRSLRYSSASVDLELFLIQYCATQFDADCFYNLLFGKFVVLESLSFFPSVNTARSIRKHASTKAANILECFSVFLVRLTTAPPPWLAYADDSQEVKRAMRRLLTALSSIKDWSGKQLTELCVPDHHASRGLLSVAQSILEEIVESDPNDAEGKILKKPVWATDYDSAQTYLLFGAVHHNNSVDRFKKRVCSTDRSSDCLPWPLLRVPSQAEYDRLPLPIRHSRLLRCSSFYAYIFTLLDRSLNSPKQVTQSMVMFVIQLLSTAVAYYLYEHKHDPVDCNYEPTITENVLDGRFECWYPQHIVDNPFKCVYHRIGTLSKNLGAYRATLRVNSSILPLLVKLHNKKTHTTYVPPRADADVTPVETLLASGFDFRQLLDLLHQYSPKLVENQQPPQPTAS